MTATDIADSASRAADNSVPIHYFTTVNNVGDLLNPFLVSRLFGVATHLAFNPRQPHLIAIGSFIHAANSLSHIWGTGAMSEDWKVPALSADNVYALRGKLSYGLLRSKGLALRDMPFGDPGFLVGSLKDAFATEKKYTLGIAAHYNDRHHPWVQRLLAEPNVLDLNVHRPVEEFLTDISTCEAVASSSLHGLIVAEAFGVPNVWIELSDRVVGHGFKFRDWYSVAERPQNEPDFPRDGKSEDIIADLCSKAMLHGMQIDADQLTKALPLERVVVPKPTRFRSALPLPDIRGLNAQLLDVGNINRPQQMANAGVSEGPRPIGGGDTHRTTVRTPFLTSSFAGSRAPVVSCLMVTANRPAQARVSVECYRRQSWPNRRMTIVDTGTDDALERWLNEIDDRSINYKRIERGKMTQGDVRNAAIQRARGDYLCVWNDDHLHHPFRIEAQMKAMATSHADACMLDRLMIWWPYSPAFVVSGRRLWEQTLIAKTEKMPPYASLDRGDDADFIRTLRSKARITSVNAPELYIYVEHLDSGWDGDHFENVRRAATVHFSADEHDSVLVRLRGIFPIDDYMDAIRL